MATSMKEALAKANVDLTLEEQQEEEKARDDKHRSKTVVERPTEEFTLQNITVEPFERKKYQSDPTDTLLEVPGGLTEQNLLDMIDDYAGVGNIPFAAVWCEDTLQTWLAVDKLCLDQNFIYRNDLEIISPTRLGDIVDFYNEHGAKVNPGIVTRKKCYIIDCPANESYEVYYESNYPAMKYGKATPNGMFIHKCKNRFHRDMKIIELDKLYQEESAECASELTKKPIGQDEAIIISDGCFLQNTCACAYHYLDADTLIKFAQGIVPTEASQAVLIAELCGATSALQMCRAKGKKMITYYYDNTSIINVFRNRKTEYIKEVVEYKELVRAMDNEGYSIKFIELHPKTGEERDSTNKALMYFHNYCDKECTDMARVFAKDYRSIAMSDTSDGKSFSQVKKEFTPKGRPGQSNGKCVKNNQHNGNNRYGKKF